jgi:uncharacterized membrane protein YciS (DUF1049 family)
MMLPSGKTPLQSKKFIAFLLADISWSVLLAYSIYRGETQTVTLAMVLVKGFVEAGYIGGQAWLDRYVRVAALTTPLKAAPPQKNQTAEPRPTIQLPPS